MGFLLLELAKAHIESENLHDLALTMSTIADEASRVEPMVMIRRAGS